MENITIKEMYTLEESIAGSFLSRFTYPWEALPEIGGFIKELEKSLSEEEYEKTEYLDFSYRKMNKLIGNSIVVDVLAEVFRAMFM